MSLKELKKDMELAAKAVDTSTEASAKDAATGAEKKLRKENKRLREENEANLIGSFVTEVSDSYTIDENIRNKAMRYGLEALIMSGEE